MIESLFIFSAALLVYIYAGYPALVFLLSKTARDESTRQEYQPDVSILISAYNEEQYIRETIINKLEQNYPAGKIEVIVISDSSTDATDQIVEELSKDNDCLTLIRQSPRQGKTSALNMAIKKASGEIIVFADANSIYDSHAVHELVKNFSDPDTGYVTGKMIYSNSDGSVTGDGCTTYMRYENFIRTCESKLGSLVGVDGGIDAMRKELHDTLNADQLPDFVQPLKVVEKGFRVIYEPRAILREEALSDHNSEFLMRIRVTLRALWALRDMRQLLNPLRFPLFSFQLLSHKLLRYLAWLPLIFVLLANFLLLDHGVAYWFLLCLQILFYTAAATAFILRAQPGLPVFLSVPFYFTLINLAAAIAFLRFAMGHKTVVWTPRTG